MIINVNVVSANKLKISFFLKKKTTVIIMDAIIVGYLVGFGYGREG